MQQRWWLVAAGVVGIGLAILLFPRPDTGSEVPDADPTNTQPLDFRQAKPKTGEHRVMRAASAKKLPMEHQQMRLGPNPVALEYAKARDNPASLYAGRATGPWAVIKRQLGLNGSEQALALSDEITPLVADLRMLRRDPSSARSWDELEVQQRDLHARVAASDVAAIDELLVTSLGRVEGYIGDYHKAMDLKAAADEGENTESKE